jgi:ferrous iron transport protein A
MTLSLDELPYRTPAKVASIDWDGLDSSSAQRLRNLGLDEGVVVEALHGGPVGRCPMAIRIGRMTVALRRVHARTIRVCPADALVS